jgi:hypothetical protein
VPLASEENLDEVCVEPVCWRGRVSGKDEGGTERSAADECGCGTAVSLLRFFACPSRESAAGRALLVGRKEWRERDCELLCEPEPPAPREDLD